MEIKYAAQKRVPPSGNKGDPSNLSKIVDYHGCLNGKTDDIIIGALLLIDLFKKKFFGVKSGSYCFGSFVKILERV
ncbi:hypothetical protein L1987_64287 [Smallanthus sonchifolius]|uniref:Uncharacterized protein n=1 Tax=Smallanthus sonchifolius TaxID=185202 RepID=A0ACB9CFX1_9ASTR|nr:hypothetical protein L1987_64287 [Smallanthus sonchifolius]